MLPILFSIGGFQFYTFGAFVVLAFFWGTFALWKMVTLTSHKEDDFFDAMFIGLGVGLLFARLVYVITHFSDFGFNIVRFILINGYPGLSLYGMVIGMMGMMALSFMRRKIKILDAFDHIVPGMLLALAIGKIGAFFAGVEVGVRTSFPVAVKYVGYEGLRHITPAYEGLLLFLAAFLSYKIVFAVRRGAYRKGAPTVFAVWSFALVMLIAEPFKENRILVSSFSLNGLLSAVFLLTFSGLLLYYFRGIFARLPKGPTLSIPFKNKNHGKANEQKTD